VRDGRGGGMGLVGLKFGCFLALTQKIRQDFYRVNDLILTKIFSGL